MSIILLHCVLSRYVRFVTNEECNFGMECCLCHGCLWCLESASVLYLRLGIAAFLQSPEVSSGGKFITLLKPYATTDRPYAHILLSSKKLLMATTTTCAPIRARRQRIGLLDAIRIEENPHRGFILRDSLRIIAKYSRLLDSPGCDESNEPKLVHVAWWWC